MPPRNLNRVQEMAGYLVAFATPQEGRTVKELEERFDISGTAVRNILSKYPGFRKTVPSKYPEQYWFDITRADGLNPNTDNQDSARVAGVFKTYIKDYKRQSFKSHDTPVEEIIDEVLRLEEPMKRIIEKGLHSLSMARRMGREFPTTGTLDKEEWEQALGNIVYLRNGLAKIVEFLDSLLTDERINTPMYWTVFRNTLKE